MLRVSIWRGGTSLAGRQGPARTRWSPLARSLSLSSGYAPDRRHRQGAGGVRRQEFAW